MTFTYDSTDLSTDLAKVRLAIGDTDSSDGILPDGSNLSDEEINAYLGLYDIWQEAVAPLLRIVAARYSRLANTRIGDYSETYSNVADAMRQAADDWEDKERSLWANIISYHGTDEDGDDIGHMFGKTQWGADVEDFDD